MKYLIDTNIVSELRKGRRADEAVRRWWQSVESGDVALSVIVLGEVRAGIERQRHRGDLPTALVFETWLETLEAEFARRVLPVDGRVADLWGRLQVPSPRPFPDALLVATALVHDLVLVTRNVRDVEMTGVKLLNPFYWNE